MGVSLVANKRRHNEAMGTGVWVTLHLNLGIYATNGVPFDPAVYANGPKGLVQAIIPDQGGFSFEYDFPNKKIKAIVRSTGAEVANAFDLSAVDVRSTFYMKATDP